MAPLPTILDTYRVAQKWEDIGSGQIAVNVMHFRVAGSSSALIGNAVDGSWQADQNHAIATVAHIVDYAVTPLDGSGATVHVTPVGIDAGQASGDYSPASAVVVSFGTALRGRSNRGRYYGPFTAESMISDGSLNASVNITIASAWGAFQVALAVAIADLTQVVASYKTATAHDITNNSVVPAIGTQRRRQTRVRYP